MAVKRAPLFDLIGRSPAAGDVAPAAPRTDGSSATRPPKPTVRLELKPRDPSYAPPPTDEVLIERNSAPLAPMRISSRALSIGLACVVLGVLVVWSIAFSLGKSKGERAVEPLLRRDPPRIVEPTAENALPASNPITAAPSSPTNTKSTTPGRSAAPAVQPPPATSSGTDTDPREAGLNYLYLGDFPEADARAAAAYLQQNGVDAHYIRVDTTDGGAKNPSPNDCRLFTAPGLAKGEMGQSVRQHRESEIVRLGQTWQKQFHGSSNFSGFTWRKFGA